MTFSIENRRYLGNKQRLLSFIQRVITDERIEFETFWDVFSGTGVVANAFYDKSVRTNDILACNYWCHVAWFEAGDYCETKVKAWLTQWNQVVVTDDNYMSETFGDTYFSQADCRKIGAFREALEISYQEGEWTRKEYAILMMSLLYAMDKIAQTCGHYDAYRKKASFEQALWLDFPDLPSVSEAHQCYHQDANELAKNLTVDVAYLDPPYNSRQYSDAYHVLENVARWEKPPVTGVARKMDRTGLKSDYCTTRAPQAFETLIQSLQAKVILVSYNDTESRQNARSNAKISTEDLWRILRAKGEVTVHELAFKPFSTGKTELTGLKERLFVCKVTPSIPTFHHRVPSPLNYTGGKGRLLSQLLPHFPTDIKTCVDLFGGGAVVGVNTPCQQLIYNDKLLELSHLLSWFNKASYDNILKEIQGVIVAYGLSETERYGYEAYGCESSKGVGIYNRDAYRRLREDYNHHVVTPFSRHALFYALILYGFNHQIRFNQQGGFNNPVGKRDFNASLRQKLQCFIEAWQAREVVCCAMDFEVLLQQYPLTPQDFVYVDPPYLISNAAYNTHLAGWSLADEQRLLNCLDTLHANGVRWLLSNVLSHKGQQNTILIEWLSQHQNDYHVVTVVSSYRHTHYRSHGDSCETQEVIIYNY